MLTYNFPATCWYNYTHVDMMKPCQTATEIKIYYSLFNYTKVCFPTTMVKLTVDVCILESVNLDIGNANMLMIDIAGHNSTYIKS